MKFLLLWAGVATALFAQAPTPYWLTPTNYDAAVPAEKAVLGHEPGERISSPAEIVKYMRALAAAAPKRMKLVEYGETWEHRPLVYVVIGSEANISRLPDIQSSMARLADPRQTDPAAAASLVAQLPALVWLAYGVHGNEISSPDAALLTAYHLLAAKGDSTVDRILAQDLVIIDPLENPDGRNRFVQNFEVSEGPRPDPDQLAAEHNEPWPGGRTNHYYFDMNRDWFAMTQPETRARVAAVRQWLPLVFVDLHEMGSDATYYFAPEADPYNPYITASQKASLEWFGRSNAHYFDTLGLSYFTKEGYDEFYPGYGASWPLYFGSIGMTYEQGSTRGLLVRKSDGTLVTYGDTVRRHFVTSVSTLETAANHHDQLIQNFYDYRKSAMDEGKRSGIAEYVLPRTGDVSAVDKLAAHLSDQGVEVKRAAAPFTNGETTYPVGSYVIPFAQPSYRLLRALLDPQVSMDPKFLAREEHRRAARQPSEMYDVTAWSLPLQYGIKLVGVKQPSTGSFLPVPANYQVPGTVEGGTPQLAYLVPWTTGAAGRFLAGALRAKIRVATADRAFQISGHSYPPGTLIIKVKDNGPDLAAQVAGLAAASAADVRSTSTGWTDEGPNFGSYHDPYIPADLRIAMAWDRPTSASAAGATRFLLECDFGYPVTVIRTPQLASGNLNPFQVLVLPDTQGDSYSAILGPDGVRHLRDWVQSGGTLVALGPGATSFLADPHSNLLVMEQENAADGGEKPKMNQRPSSNEKSEAAPSNRVAGTLISSEAEYKADIMPKSELPDFLHGVLVHAKVDEDSWMAAGLPPEVNVMVTGRTIFSPVKENAGTTAVRFEDSEHILASGFMWEPNRKQLAYKPFVVVKHEGRGNIIAFTADPNFRGYMDGLNLLFLNAVFRGPAHVSASAY